MPFSACLLLLYKNCRQINAIWILSNACEWFQVQYSVFFMLRAAAAAVVVLVTILLADWNKLREPQFILFWQYYFTWLVESSYVIWNYGAWYTFNACTLRLHYSRHQVNSLFFFVHRKINVWWFFHYICYIQLEPKTIQTHRTKSTFNRQRKSWIRSSLRFSDRSIPSLRYGAVSVIVVHICICSRLKLLFVFGSMLACY